VLPRHHATPGSVVASHSRQDLRERRELESRAHSPALASTAGECPRLWLPPRRVAAAPGGRAAAQSASPSRRREKGGRGRGTDADTRES
jgi:hypothetical protein